MEEDLILVVDSDIKLEGLKQLEQIPQKLLEYNIYQRFGDTKLFYRLDKGNNAPGQQRHIHVFKDFKGRVHIFSINFDGTKHDGSLYQLSLKEQSALAALGISIPPKGLLESEDGSTCNMLLFD